MFSNSRLKRDGIAIDYIGDLMVLSFVSLTVLFVENYNLVICLAAGRNISKGE